MQLPDRIVLIGFMGSGKSTVGSLLARRLGRAFVDTDALVEAQAGKSVQRVFAEEGEPAFRDAEAAVLGGLARRSGIVVATGGGAPAQERNAWFFRAEAATFYLRVSLASARERIRPDGTRPLLQQADDDVRKLFTERLSVYESLGMGVDTDGRAPREVAEEILRLLEDPTRSPPPGGGA
jgi:shikimate kinase